MHLAHFKPDKWGVGDALRAPGRATTSRCKAARYFAACGLRQCVSRAIRKACERLSDVRQRWPIPCADRQRCRFTPIWRSVHRRSRWTTTLAPHQRQSQSARCCRSPPQLRLYVPAADQPQAGMHALIAAANMARVDRRSARSSRDTWARRPPTDGTLSRAPWSWRAYGLRDDLPNVVYTAYDLSYDTRMRLAVCLSVAWKFERQLCSRFPRRFYDEAQSALSAHVRAGLHRAVLYDRFGARDVWHWSSADAR